MAKVRLPLKGLTDVELLSLGRVHQSQMQGNAEFPNPIPDEAAFATATDTWESQMAAARQAEVAYRAAIAAKKTGRKTYENILRQRAKHVESVWAGQPGKVVSVGFDLRRDSQPVGRLPAPIRFTATMGDRPGQIRLRWKRVPGAAIYQLEYQRYTSVDDPWQYLGSATAAKYWTADLESGVNYAFRVAAVGTAGPSPWAGPLFRIAP